MLFLSPEPAVTSSTLGGAPRDKGQDGKGWVVCLPHYEDGVLRLSYDA